MTHPFFSIILPNYNHGKFIRDAINSVINQNFKHWELIIIDNNSTDDSEKIIKSYKDPRIKFFKIKNNGIIAKSRNLGIKKSKADWIAFLDSDDLWYANKLSSIRSFIGEYSCDVVCSNEYKVNLKNNKKTPLYYSLKTKNVYKELLLYGNKLSTSSTLVSRNFLLKNRLFFDESFKLITVEDYDFWLQIAKHKGSFGFFKEFLGEYRIHNDNLSNNFELHYINLKNLIQKHIHEIQEFENIKILEEYMEPRFSILFLKHSFKNSFLNGIRETILFIKSMNLKKGSVFISYFKSRLNGI